MANVRLSNKMSERVRLLVSKFLERGRVSPVMKSEYLLMLDTIVKMIDDNTPFEQVEMNVVIFLLDAYFAAFEEFDVDPLAEQSYAKLTGYWSTAFDAPYYDRCVRYADVVGYKSGKSSRKEMGF